MKLLWYFTTIAIIVLILISNPKAEGLGILGGQSQLFNNTRQATTVLESIIWTVIILFLSFTTILAMRYEQ
uniref:Preprotein translocase subunit G n=1 Tax=Nemalion vermiculare TaxID=935621 RepID=UPI00257B1ACF|nr:Preprotein translocase subunit G [Nemalion vermiculare]WGV34468.1 Preprotein translocase subunit G [Nemalion vermiculare]